MSKLQDTKELVKITKVSKDSDKYKVALKLVNKILVNLGKDEIDDLTKFVDVDREDIIKDVNKKSFEEMEIILFKHFDKAKCGWYKRKKVKNYILTFLRYMCDLIGYEFSYIQRDITTEVDSKKYRKTCMFYSIK